MNNKIKTILIGLFVIILFSFSVTSYGQNRGSLKQNDKIELIIREATKVSIQAIKLGDTFKKYGYNKFFSYYVEAIKTSYEAIDLYNKLQNFTENRLAEDEAYLVDIFVLRAEILASNVITLDEASFIAFKELVLKHLNEK